MAILEHGAIEAASLASSTADTTADWISAVCSLLGAIVALLTLITVCFASDQILTRHRLGLSKQCLGTWKSVVVLPSALRMQTRIMTPTISVSLLVAKRWQPKISSSAGFGRESKGTNGDLEASGTVLVQASWVNFLEGLGMSPENGKDFYRMRYESESVNGIVPVRWKGRDLAAICSILGFQSIESKPNNRKLMELPTQWSGPLGWLQFRHGSGGCIVEYRRRSVTKDQLPREFHSYYQDLGVESRPFKFKSRLWQSITGMCLSDNEVISFSDTSGWAEKMGDCGGNTEQSANTDYGARTECVGELAGEIKREMFDRKANRPQGLRAKDFEDGMSQVSPQHTCSISGLLRNPGSDMRAMEGNSKKTVVLCPSPGHLSVAIEGELVDSRGLGNDGTHEYSYIYTDEDGVGKVYKHKLGCLRMDTDLLALMKKAVLQIEPDGFYFSPSGLLNFQVSQIWSHASSISERLLDQKCIFSRTRNTSYAMLTIGDLLLISKASVSLRGLIGHNGMDLVWAILASPELFSHLDDCIACTQMQDLLDSTLTCESGRFDFTQMKYSDQEARQAPGEIEVELVGDSAFEGIQIVAAFVDVFLNFFWIDRGWITDIALYDITMPQSVTMC
ncbi:hypothetical protein C7212DRAFT_283057 [Tuber magnatum]|uniref:Uncharacterized protein n=1 Tax=Tuber magnatum TaxID=42249 RepID=A0A317SJJ0_9PEZI|nr:hypothetical protein C7212DRAFT_283057 [Tuber magnatum]